MLNKYIFSLLALVFFNACASQSPAIPLSVLLKSEQIKFKGEGFLNAASKSLRLDLYHTGEYVFSIKIGEKICLAKKCYKKHTFNENFFHKIYYDDLLLDILLCKPIFLKKNYQKTERGFRQESRDYSYEKTQNSCIFRQNDKTIRIVFH